MTIQIIDKQSQDIIDTDASSILSVNLTDDIEHRIIDDITDDMSKIMAERDQIGLHDKITQRWAYYHGDMDKLNLPPGPFGDASARYYIHLIAQVVDIIAVKATRQTIVPRPLVQLDPLEDLEMSVLRDREDLLDWILRYYKGVNIEELIRSVYREAIVQGTSVVKVSSGMTVEYPVYNETYRPSADGLASFRRDFADQLKAGDQKFKDYLTKLEQGTSVTIPVTTRRVLYHGPVAYRVPLERFFCRPSIPDLSKQRWVSELRHMTWYDIKSRKDTGYYSSDQVQKLIERAGDDYLTRTYDVYEGIYTGDVTGKTSDQYRYIISYESTTNTVLRCVYYPLRSHVLMYVPYYIRRSDDTFYGWSIVDRLIPAADAITSSINSAIDAIALRNAPPMMVPDEDSAKQFDARQWGPGAIYINRTHTNPIQPIPLTFGGGESMQLANLIQRYAEASVGVSATYMSGRESPLDPSAPAAKAAMLLNESNAMIEDMIMSLQSGNARLAEVVDHIMAHINTSWSYVTPSGVRKQLSSVVLRPVVRYVPAGTRIAVDRISDLQILVAFIKLCSELAPQLASDPQWVRTVLETYVSHTGGAIEREKERLLKPLSNPPMRTGGVNDVMKSLIMRVVSDPQLSDDRKRAILSELDKRVGQSLEGTYDHLGQD